jgi:hypothetical protein
MVHCTLSHDEEIYIMHSNGKKYKNDKLRIAKNCPVIYVNEDYPIEKVAKLTNIPTHSFVYIKTLLSCVGHLDYPFMLSKSERPKTKEYYFMILEKNLEIIMKYRTGEATLKEAVVINCPDIGKIVEETTIVPEIDPNLDRNNVLRGSQFYVQSSLPANEMEDRIQIAGHYVPRFNRVDNLDEKTIKQLMDCENEIIAEIDDGRSYLDDLALVKEKCGVDIDKDTLYSIIY